MLPLDVQEWEGVARELVERAGADDPPVDAFEVADCWGFDIELAPITSGELELDRRLIRISARDRRERQQMHVAHELGHFGLLRAGLPNVERGAKYVAGAIMLPRWRFDRDLARVGRSIPELRRIHTNVSSIAIAVRITQLRDAVATIIDPRGRIAPWRVASPWITEPRITKRVSAWERDLAARAYESGSEVRGDRGDEWYALPVFDDADAPGEDRVIVVVEPQQLALRL